MITFQQFFENMTAGIGGVFGEFGSAEWSPESTSTSYADSDARIPKILGSKKKKAKKNGKKSKKQSGFQYFKR